MSVKILSSQYLHFRQHKARLSVYGVIEIVGQLCMWGGLEVEVTMKLPHSLSTP